MATKRQRRRREKLHRHDYELVEIDESGEERPVKADAKQREGAQPRGGKVVDHRGRVIPEPSWQRSLKRGLIFAPILAILVFATGSDISTGAKILNIIVLLLIFLPVTYFMDRLLYNRVLRRQGQSKRRSP